MSTRRWIISGAVGALGTGAMVGGALGAFADSSGATDVGSGVYVTGPETAVTPATTTRAVSPSDTSAPSSTTTVSVASAPTPASPHSAVSP
ncbi:MAG: hypothetical protein ACTMIR_01565, partial [Cellulomonadaceae bacterium]